MKALDKIAWGAAAVVCITVLGALWAGGFIAGFIYEAAVEGIERGRSNYHRLHDRMDDWWTEVAE